MKIFERPKRHGTSYRPWYPHAKIVRTGGLIRSKALAIFWRNWIWDIPLAPTLMCGARGLILLWTLDCIIAILQGNGVAAWNAFAVVMMIFAYEILHKIRND